MELMEEILEDILQGTFQFSCEATQKQAEKIAKDLSNFKEGKVSADPVLVELFQPENQDQSSNHDDDSSEVDYDFDNEAMEREAWINIDDLDDEASEGEAWINVDDLNKNDDLNDIDDEEIQESVSSPMETKEETVVEPEKVEDEVANVEPSSNDEQQISELVNFLQQSEGSCLSRELSDTLASLSESLLSSVLVTIRNSATETALVSMCLTVCENMGLREQGVVASLLCSQALLPKIQEAELQGPLLAATCRLAVTVPSVVASQLLLPLLISGEENYDRACHLVTTCDSEELRHALLRCLLDERAQQLCESDLELLKLLLKTPARDADTTRKVCVMFGQLGPSLDTSTNFSKLLLQTIKSIPKGSLGKENEKQLNVAVMANKTGLKKMLEKSLAK